MVEEKWAESVTVKSEFPVRGDRMLAKKADKVFTKDTVGLNGTLAL